MKKQSLLFLAFIIVAHSYAQNFVVNNFEVDIYINADGYFDVVEKYELTFDAYKHGIYRDIRTKYDLIDSEEKEGKREIKISNIEVPNHRFEATNGFARKLEGNLRIKIGDPDKTVIGPQYYEIKYRVARAFLHEPTADRFYWNLKPTQWLAPFKQMKFRIHLPQNSSIGSEDYFVYSGTAGITYPSKEFTTQITNRVVEGISVPDFNSGYGQGVTVLINLPPDSIKEYKPLWPFWTKYGWLLIIGGLISIFYILFRKYGKDEHATTTISYFPPEGMDPAMAGFLINDRDDTSDLVSLIPYWGSRGHLKMEEIDNKGWFVKDDTKITKLKDLPDDAPSYQKKLFNGLFSGASNNEVLMSSLKNTFYTTMSAASTQLKKAAQRYYEPKSRAVKKITGGLLVVLCVLLIPLVLYVWGVLPTIIVFVSCVVLLILNIFMIKKNTRGNKVFGELKGFKQFIKTAEENKLKMLLKESPTYFESTMGYALTFGAFRIWARKFSALNVPPPDWYTGPGGSHYSMNKFSNSFSSTISAASSTMVSSPSSSGSGGGGSSGGGFGGGGGGSW